MTTQTIEDNVRRGCPLAAYQSEWRIDTAHGNDRDDGSASHPIQTIAQLVYRLSWGGVIRPQTSIAVVVSGTIPVTDPLRLPLEASASGSFVLRGERTVVGSGFISDFVPRSTIARHGITLTDIEQDFSTLVDKLIVITASDTPAHVGAAARILATAGPHACHTTTFSFFDPATTAFAGATEVVPSIGDAYGVYSLPRIESDIRIDLDGPVLNIAGLGKTVIADFDIATSQIGRSSIAVIDGGNDRLVIQNCIQSNGTTIKANECVFVNHYCLSGQVIVDDGISTQFYGGGSKVNQNWSSGVTYLRLGFVMQGALLNLFSSASLQIQDFMSFDWPEMALRLNEGSSVLNFGTWSGSSAAPGSYPLQIRGGSYTCHDGAVVNNPIHGALGTDFNLNGFASGPAYARISQWWTADRDYTWSNLDAAVAAGGFDRAATDPQNGSASIHVNR